MGEIAGRPGCPMKRQYLWVETPPNIRRYGIVTRHKAIQIHWRNYWHSALTLSWSDMSCMVSSSESWKQIYNIRYWPSCYRLIIDKVLKYLQCTCLGAAPWFKRWNVFNIHQDAKSLCSGLSKTCRTWGACETLAVHSSSASISPKVYLQWVKQAKTHQNKPYPPLSSLIFCGVMSTPIKRKISLMPPLKTWGWPWWAVYLPWRWSWHHKGTSSPAPRSTQPLHDSLRQSLQISGTLVIPWFLIVFGTPLHS